MKEGTTGISHVKRFSLYRIIEHWLTAAVFVVLVVTGLSQKFYTFNLSQWFVMSLGGIDNIRLVHRVCGMIFVCLVTQHVLIAFFGVIGKKWLPSMLITRKDFTDAVDNLKYYFGLTNSQARCGRYDYKQKFEYWGILAGGLIMVATGLTLWFPSFVAGFLPGSIIPAAKALHTNVAMMIFLIIALWHIYNSIFSPEVFPLDLAIITGRISLDRMMREHPIEFERLFGVSIGEGENGVAAPQMREERRQESS